MESVEIGDLKVLLMGKIFDGMVHELDFFLAFAVLEIVVLHLVKDEQNAVETYLMDIVQECG